MVVTVQHKGLTASHGGRGEIFYWVPSHVRIPGNDAADRLARFRAERPTDVTFLPNEDYKSEFRHFMIRK